MQDVENLFLEVGKAIEEHKISEAKNILEEILSIDPGYGRAHNHLGWIYETKIKDYAKAQRHYELAIKFCRGTYPIVYVNYAYLLIEFNHFEKAKTIIEEGLKIEGSDKATLKYQQGKIQEHLQNYYLSYQLYNTALKLNFNKEFHQFLQQEITRLKTKMNFIEKLRIRLHL